MKLFNLLIVVTLVFCARSIDTNEEFIDLGFEMDLLPEGVAVDGESQKIYLNSLRHNKIVSCNLDGSNPMDFIQSNQYDYLSGFGMTIKGDTLYALGNSLPKENNRSTLLMLNKNTGVLFDSYGIDDTTCIYLNDLAISSTNEIFITDSESNRIYRIKRPDGDLEVFLENDELKHTNGIAISADDRYLYLASLKGIGIVEILSKQIVNELDNRYTGIDGLKFFNNSLIGIVNWGRDEDKLGVYRYSLTEDGAAISKAENIIPHGDHFQVPTTFDILGDIIFFVINTQLDNYNDQTNQIRTPDKLVPYILMRKRI